MSPSPPGNEPLIRLLWQAHNWFRTAMAAALDAQHGTVMVSPAHMTLLSQLPSEGTTIAELARRLGVSSPTAHQWVHELAGLDFLTVEAHPSTARAKLVRPTETGRRRRAQALQALAGLEAALAERIGADAVAALRAALESPWGPPESAVGIIPESVLHQHPPGDPPFPG
ncbi:MarR family winged helix-turn-helix transcriptional regulator [Streptomyces sp. Li-HN-5-11]|uniref:MarR family winged helix-turn-helix transcriptional regulator n=1 Tax=Streptomyces sp. Li-HN-5-11 TaxID=3075432 RepID=UPI0028A8254D|nr:MarR family winged helix-turn-helix transcriptional regulator [Streptomyces sp. Li-HN-5-11]WNM31954.1 MarR family winged helix-turn-helix transcriptional regulator [Streptomyces sp. Li-HN-5-11]